MLFKSNMELRNGLHKQKMDNPERAMIGSRCVGMSVHPGVLLQRLLDTPTRIQGLVRPHLFLTGCKYTCSNMAQSLDSHRRAEAAYPRMGKQEFGGI